MTEHERPPHPPENQDAQPDVEKTARELYEVKDKIADLEKEKERLRKILLDKVTGHRYFIDSEGKKRYVFVSEPETLVVDIDILEELVDHEVFVKVTKVEIDKEKFKTAVGHGNNPLYKGKGVSIKPDVFLRVARSVPMSKRVGFGDPEEPRGGS